MMHQSNALPVDTMLEEYQIQSVLGTGGFGITYKAWDANLESWVAIKEYFPTEWSYRDHDGVTVRANTQGLQSVADPDLPDYEWGLDRFLDEARVLARVRNPFVVRINRYFRANGSAYIVMDYEDGEPLSAVLRRRGNLDEADLRGMLKEILPALLAVHEQGFLHRDIKPSNLYVRADGCVILIDFGAARQSLGRQSKSVTGLVTPGYSPPEQYALRSDRYGTWTDIYALGAVLYRCISGQPPVESAERLIEDSLIPAKEVGFGRYSEALLSVVDRALAVRPEHRYQSIEQMQADLDEMLGNAAAGKPEPHSRTMSSVQEPNTLFQGNSAQFPSQQKAELLSSPSKRLFSLSMALLVAVLVAALVWWQMNDVGPDSPVIVSVESPPADPVEQPILEAQQPPAVPTDDRSARSFLWYLNAFNQSEGFAIGQNFWWQTVENIHLRPGETGSDTPESDLQQQINRLLELAEMRLREDRLSTPEGDSALYYYHQVLSLSPGNRGALQVRRKILDRYAELANSALRKGNITGAQALINRGLNIDPQNARLRDLRGRSQQRRPVTRVPAVRIPRSVYPQQPTVSRDDLLNRDSR